MSRNVRMAVPLVDFGVWTRSMDNASENGDSYLVKPAPNGVLLVVADGLGHGPEAAVAAQAAMACVQSYSGQGVIPLFQLCHSALKKTRGVVMNLAFFNGEDNTLTWLGVGNVAGVLVRADADANPAHETLLLRGGVLGLNLPQLYATVMPILPGDTLIFATDGIASSFADSLTSTLDGCALSGLHSLRSSDSPQKLAEKIGFKFTKGTDDALVVAGRYRGF